MKWIKHLEIVNKVRDSLVGCGFHFAILGTKKLLHLALFAEEKLLFITWLKFQGNSISAQVVGWFGYAEGWEHWEMYIKC